MMESRRRLLITFFAAGVPPGILVRVFASQKSNQPLPRGAQPKEADPDAPKVSTKAILEANQKDIKRNVERLFQLASELKAEVEKTDSALVLSLGMLRKAEEIEKLAKEIKSRAKG